MIALEPSLPWTGDARIPANHDLSIATIGAENALATPRLRVDYPDIQLPEGSVDGRATTLPLVSPFSVLRFADVQRNGSKSVWLGERAGPNDQQRRRTEVNVQRIRTSRSISCTLSHCTVSTPDTRRELPLRCNAGRDLRGSHLRPCRNHRDLAATHLPAISLCRGSEGSLAQVRGRWRSLLGVGGDGS
jgi:hypothetical protein